MTTIDWTNRWLGGFCSLGIYGAPVRGEDAPTAPPLAQQLIFCGDRVLQQSGSVTAEQVTALWRTWLTGSSIQR